MVRKTLAKHRVAMAVQPGRAHLRAVSPLRGLRHRPPRNPRPLVRLRGLPHRARRRGSCRFRGQSERVDGRPGPGRHGDHHRLRQHSRRTPKQLLNAIRHAYRRHARIVGICSGAFVLAHAGLLDHRRATTHWMHIDDFATLFPAVILDPSVLYVEDDGVFTSAGTAAAIDLCLELVRQDLGAAAANEVARRMVIPPHRDGGQAQYLRWPMPPNPDHDLAQAMQWAGQPRPPHHRRRPHPTRPPKPAHVDSTLPRRPRRDPSTLAATPTASPRPRSARNVLPTRRARRRALRHGIGSQPPPPLQRTRRRFTTRLPTHLRHAHPTSVTISLKDH